MSTHTHAQKEARGWHRIRFLAGIFIDRQQFVNHFFHLLSIQQRTNSSIFDFNLTHTTKTKSLLEICHCKSRERHCQSSIITCFFILYFFFFEAKTVFLVYFFCFQRGRHICRQFCRFLVFLNENNELYSCCCRFFELISLSLIKYQLLYI